MRIGLQLLLGYVLVAILACYLVFTVFLKEVKPTVRHATEEMLIDTASLLASIVAQDLASIDEVQRSSVVQVLTDNSHKSLIEANINGMIKNKMTYRVYITDKKGIVVFDSDKRDEGKDYSRWNDVYLTLQGKYGARVTNTDPDDATSSVMYVAAPIKVDGDLIGVLTVSKPNQSMSSIIDRGEQHILLGGMILIFVALAIGVFIISWVNYSIKKLVNYASQVSNRQNVALPKLASAELKTLANALEDMRLKLDGKDYIEKYVHTLAHELKSPLSSIRAATEILQNTNDKLPQSVNELDKTQKTQSRFLSNIDQQTERMSILIERMLQLARLESRVGVNFQSLNMREIISQVIESQTVEAQSRGIELVVHKNDEIIISGDKFLLIQALTNLFSNALDFTPVGGKIELNAMVKGNYYSVEIKDNGRGIPEYAINRIYERFYSLPRPNKGKSSGLGLSFVKEVAIVHNGEISVVNRTDGQGAVAIFMIKIHPNQ
ncbi:two-component system sensor histidine kinase CreC [Orbus sturtevantii]|uniref:two-component system sensor histidine kinase CreC n=1 Tax=Orbus sturtevantii TaxID=3074109 RepID=UPI00370D8873